MSSTFTCRWAALGLSNIASVFVPDILLPRADNAAIKHKIVAASTTRKTEEAKAWFSEHGIKDAESITIFNDWNEMVENGDFDVVYISTPHPLHYQHVRKALECKRHVLVEKPATMNVGQFDALAELANKNGVILMEAMWTRYLPATRYLQENLLPRIGQVKRVYADFSFPIFSEDMSHSSRFLDKDAGAGSLLDQGVYALTWVDLALHGLSGDSSETKVVYASSMALPSVPNEVDDIDTLVLSNTAKNSEQQQAVAIVSTSMSLPGSNKPAFYQRLQAKKQAPSVRIEATKATIAIPFPPIRPQEFHVLWYGEHVDKDGIEVEEVIKKEVETGWGLHYQADFIAKRIASKQVEVIGYLESRRVLQWMDAARKQAGIVYDSKLEQV